jgi:hypothetical protein
MNQDKEFIEFILGLLKDSGKVQENNNDILCTINNTDNLDWIINNYENFFSGLLPLLEIPIIKKVLNKYNHLAKYIFEYFEHDDENLNEIFTSNYTIDIVGLSIIHNKDLLLVRCLSSGIKLDIHTYQLLIEYDLLDLMISINLINKNDINYSDICIHLIEQQDKESLVLPIIFLYLKEDDIDKVFNEALSWGRSKVVKFMKIYYGLSINLENIVDSHLLKELTLIGVY